MSYMCTGMTTESSPFRKTLVVLLWNRSLHFLDGSFSVRARGLSNSRPILLAQKSGI